MPCMIGAFWLERQGICVDEWTLTGGLSAASALSALLVYLRRRRRKGGPRLRLRLYGSFRTHGSEPTDSTEPPPFPKRDQTPPKGDS